LNKAKSTNVFSDNNFAKKKNLAQRIKIRPLTMLWPYIVRYRRYAIGAAGALIIASAIMLALPIAMRRMFDYGFGAANAPLINAYFITLLALAGGLSLASAMRYYCVITLGERVINDVRRDVFAHLMQLSPEFYDLNHSGELTSRLSADTTQIKSTVGASLSIALRNLIMVIGSLAMMVLTSPKLSMLVLLVIPLILIPLFTIGRKVRYSSRLAQDALANANALAAEQIANIRTLQAFNAQNFITARFYLLCEQALRAVGHSIKARAWLTALAILLVFSGVVAVLWIGARDVLAGQMSAGTLGQFVLYAVFSASSFGQLSEVASELAQTAGAMERLSELLNTKPTLLESAKSLPQNGQGEKMRGQICFDNVSFSYPTRPDGPCLHNVSFKIAPSETVAFVGASGAGKSTIFSLLLRFYDPKVGRIMIDDQALPDFTLRSLRELIAYVPQEAAIFAGSVRDNITFGLENITSKQLEQAIESAQSSDFIAQLPQGLDTWIGERGVTLSGGQRQRLAIARALLRNCPILLLDEATSALDAQSEGLIQSSFDHLSQGRTTLIIAHRLATILKADRIIVLDQGRIVEEGSHQELMAFKGRYATLAKLQFIDP